MLARCIQETCIAEQQVRTEFRPVTFGGEGVQPGPMSNLSSPRTFCGWGAGSTCFWVDPQMDLSFAFLSTGLMEETYHLERLQRLADLVVTSLTD